MDLIQQNSFTKEECSSSPEKQYTDCVSTSLKPKKEVPRKKREKKARLKEKRFPRKPQVMLAGQCGTKGKRKSASPAGKHKNKGKGKPGIAKSGKKENNQNISSRFFLKFNSPVVSLKDKDVLSIFEILMNAEDVTMHRKITVKCKNDEAARQLMSKVKRFNTVPKKFRVLHADLPNAVRKTMVYAVGLSKQTTENNVIKCFKKAEDCNIFVSKRGKKSIRVGEITFRTEKDAKIASSKKERYICGKRVGVTQNKYHIGKRQLDKKNNTPPAKKAKVNKESDTDKTESTEACTGATESEAEEEEEEEEEMQNESEGGDLEEDKDLSGSE